MRLYNAPSGNTKRVRIFIAEKAIDVPRVELELIKDTRTEDFRKLNSLGELPVLELDDGDILTESVAICRYLEAAFPAIPLMGTSAYEQGNIAMWQMRIHGQIFMTYGLMVRHTLSIFADIVDQVPEFARTQREAIPDKWRWLESEMSDGRKFIAGDGFSFADVEGMTVLMIADAMDVPIPEDCRFVRAWADGMRRRPSWHA